MYRGGHLRYLPDFGSFKSAIELVPSKLKNRYFVLLLAKTFLGFLDLLGIALIGLLASVAASKFNSGVHLFKGFNIPRSSPELLISLAGLTLGLFLVKTVLALFVSKRLSHLLSQVDVFASKRISSYIYGGLLGTKQEYSDSEAEWAINESVTQGFSLTLSAFAVVVSEGATLLLIICMFVFVDPVASLFTVLYFSLVVGGMQLFLGTLHRRAGDLYHSGAAGSATLLSDISTAYKELSVYQLREEYLDRLSTERSKAAAGRNLSTFLYGVPRYIVETALMVGVLLFIGFQLLAGNIAEGATVLGIFLAGGVRLTGTTLPLYNAIAGLRTYSEPGKSARTILRIANDYFSTLSQPKDIHSEKNKISTSKVTPSLSLRNLSFSFTGDEIPVLSNFSCVFPAGTMTAIIGESGAGKTTLADLIIGLLQPKSGDIFLTDKNNLVISPSKVNISYVPQNPGLIHGTIAQNVSLCADISQIDYVKVEEALLDSGLWDFVSSLKEGVNTSVGEGIQLLSGGQVQRIGLSRALYRDPTLLVLDEATSALDANTEFGISQTLMQLHDRVTVIVIAHRLSTIQHADQILLLEKGVLKDSGTFKDIRERNPEIEQMIALMNVKNNKETQNR